MIERTNVENCEIYLFCVFGFVQVLVLMLGCTHLCAKIYAFLFVIQSEQQKKVLLIK